MLVWRPAARSAATISRMKSGTRQVEQIGPAFTPATAAARTGKYVLHVEREVHDAATDSRGKSVGLSRCSTSDPPGINASPVGMRRIWLASKDSNLESPDPESGALPFGHSPATVRV